MGQFGGGGKGGNSLDYPMHMLYVNVSLVYILDKL